MVDSNERTGSREKLKSKDTSTERAVIR